MIADYESAQKIHEQLFSLKEYQKAHTVGIYLSMPSGEISTKHIVRDALRSGKKVFVPYLYQDKSLDPPRSVMDMVSLHSQQDYEAFKPDKWGIPTPDSTSIPGRQKCLGTQSEDVGMDEDAHSKLDLILVPGVAFDKEYRRLGHGKGYYDFFLSRYHANEKTRGGIATTMPLLGKDPAVRLMEVYSFLIVGLALQEQVLPQGHEVPVTITDWQLDILIVGDGSILRPHSIS